MTNEKASVRGSNEMHRPFSMIGEELCLDGRASNKEVEYWNSTITPKRQAGTFQGAENGSKRAEGHLWNMRSPKATLFAGLKKDEAKLRKTAVINRYIWRRVSTFFD
jgi:hypothetical protein